MANELNQTGLLESKPQECQQVEQRQRIFQAELCPALAAPGYKMGSVVLLYSVVDMTQRIWGVGVD